MRLRQRDYLLVALGVRLAPLLRRCGELESDLVRARLAAVRIEQPIFITGLARSGTTLLLNLLAQIPGIATHRYRDFPFLWTPIAWNWLQSRIAAKEESVERPHRDRIYITADSPEAFEEPLWQFFFPHAHSENGNHVLDETTDASEFEVVFCDHIRKILLIRGGDRYLSKGNYNVSRIAFLGRLFPDARFVVPIRDPVSHVHSLVKQHRLFSAYAAQDARIPKYLMAAGHYEFGPQRRPINIHRNLGERVADAWRRGDEYRGYAALWAGIYGHVATLVAERPSLSERIHIVNYDLLCRSPREQFARILDFADLDLGAAVLDRLDHIEAPPPSEAELSDDDRRAVESEARFVAGHYGYLAS
jgi:hypothetical protein